MNPQSYADDLQDDDLARQLVEKQVEMEGERLPWEDLYKQVEQRVDPVAMGGFTPTATGGQRGAGNLDGTAPEGLDRYEAAMGGLLVPRNQRWHGLVTTDGELNKLDATKRWCEHAVDRLFAMRYNPDAGFETQFYEDIRSAGLYGTAPLWVDEIVGKQLFYKALHLSEVWIDEDFRGRVDVTHRKFERTARQCAQEFPNGLSPKMREALANGKDGARFTLLSVIRPNRSFDRDRWDWRGKRYESITIALDEKWIMKRSGYHSMPLLVSRASTSPRDKYGRSPAMKVLGSIKGANEMARTILRAAHKAVDPPLLYHDELQLTSIRTKPGGLNPGGVDEFGRQMIQPMASGGNLPIGIEMLEAERQTIKTAFLDHAFALLFERGDRMTATEVLEIARQQGVLLAPTAGRMET
uniref:portal protein n=1 Tax=Rhizorhabdus sp. TaxID=1968843 RepID=UPI0035B161F7